MMNLQEDLIAVSVLFIVAIARGRANPDNFRIIQNLPVSQNQIFSKLGFQKLPSEGPKDSMEVSTAQIMTELFNNTDSEVISILPEVADYKFNENHEKQLYIWYNVSGSSVKKNQLYLFELRLYKKSIIDKNNYTVSVYRNCGKGLISHLVDAKNISGDYDGWIVMNITETMDLWLNTDNDNRGLCVTAEMHKNSSGAGITDIGIAGIDDKGFKPFIVGYFNNENDKTECHSDEKVIRKSRDVWKFRASSHCNVRQWFVNFADIGLDSIIIHPPGYWANYCSGDCPYVDDVNFHSLLQTRTHFHYPTEVPSVNCSPTKFSSIHLLYFIDKNIIVRKLVREMIVDACECR